MSVYTASLALPEMIRVYKNEINSMYEVTQSTTSAVCNGYIGSSLDQQLSCVVIILQNRLPLMDSGIGKVIHESAKLHKRKYDPFAMLIYKMENNIGCLWHLTIPQPLPGVGSIDKYSAAVFPEKTSQNNYIPII